MQLILSIILKPLGGHYIALMWNFVRLIFPQNYLTEPKRTKRNWRKYLILFWLIQISIVFCYISASLSANLTIEDKSHQINSIDDLIVQQKNPLWIIGSNELPEVKKNPTNEMKKLYNYAYGIGIKKCQIKANLNIKVV